MPYVGRFAPSPTGPLHLGSLVAALASYLDAKANDGEWLLRIEDIDPPREPKGAALQILDALSSYGLQHDRKIVWQSAFLPRHRRAVDQLLAEEKAFYCYCSRSDLSGGVHLGVCGEKANSNRAPSIRFNLSKAPQTVVFQDRIQGEVKQDLASEVGDFVLWRVEDWPSYQLACVVDDADAGVTDVVRGLDLLDSTPRQMVLQQALGLSTPRYAHIPLVLGSDGKKLSKQNLAPALDLSDSEKLTQQALSFLFEALERGPNSEIAGFVENWRAVAARQF